MTSIFLFPGQSSIRRDIFGTARAVDPEVTAAVLAEASAVLGWDLEAHYAKDEPFGTNLHVQIGVFVANHLHLQALRARGIDAAWSLGLSLGEYNHLVHIGALSFAEGLRLVAARGAAYDAGPDGMMAAVYPITVEELEPIVERARAKGFVAISNYNAPGQQVIAGERIAVQEALRLLDEELFIEGKVIEERIAMHTEAFRPVVATFEPALKAATWGEADCAYVPNATAEIVAAPTCETYVQRLSEHVVKPVLWQKSIDLLRQRIPDACFVEVGPRTVLHDMLRKTWVGDVPRLHTSDAEAFAATVDALTERIRMVAGSR